MFNVSGKFNLTYWWNIVMLISFIIIIVSMTTGISFATDFNSFLFGFSGLFLGIGRAACIRRVHAEYPSADGQGIFHGTVMVYEKTVAGTVFYFLSFVTFCFLLYKINWGIVLS